MKWLAQKRQNILDQWFRNELSMIEAIQLLVSTGYSATDAWKKLSR